MEMDARGRKVTSKHLRSSDRTSPDEELNRSIVELLQRDGRMAFSEIAQKLGVSEGTIRNRVSGMRQAGMLEIAAIIEPVVGEYKTAAMLGLKVAAGHSPHSVASRLEPVADVVYILWVTGRFDLLVEVVTDSRESFLEFLDRSEATFVGVVRRIAIVVGEWRNHDINRSVVAGKGKGHPGKRQRACRQPPA